MINNSGSVKPDDFFLKVARGLIPGHTPADVAGRNPSLDTLSPPEDVWEGGGNYTGHPLHSNPAEAIEVFSSDAGDAGAGIGANAVRVFGLDQNWDLVEEDIVLNGITPVATVSLWHRVYRVLVLAAGSSAENIGTITVRHVTTTANVFAAMSPGTNQTSMAIYTVPANKTLYVVDFFTGIARSGGTPGSAEYTARIRPEGSVYQSRFERTITTEANNQFSEKLFLEAPAKSDLKVRCESVSDNSTVINSVFRGILVDD